MLPAHIEKALVEIEHSLDNVTVALVSGEPVALMAVSESLRQASADCSAFMNQLPPVDRKSKELKFRLGKIAADMAAQRESLIRRTVLVEMALNAVVPATFESTYGKAAGPYGSAGKQSGTFKYLAA